MLTFLGANSLRLCDGPSRRDFLRLGAVGIGGLQMGQVIGRTDKRGERPVGKPYTPQNLLATLYRALGIDLSTTLPDHTGRPVHLLDDCEPIKELL